jgi:hypothetical protein
VKSGAIWTAYAEAENPCVGGSISPLPPNPVFSSGPDRTSDASHFCRLAFAVALLGSTAAYSQGQYDRRHELGVRYWLSSGETRWNHTSGDPLLGDPTSVLTYGKLQAHTAELYFRRFLGASWFVRGDLGIGKITKGSFDDEDYFATQLKFSDTTSPVEGNWLRYLTLDLGKVVLNYAERRPEVYVFAGYQYWSERYDAYGLTYRVNLFGDPDLGTNVPVISNEIRWSSIRAGVGGKYKTGPYTFSVDLALVPYTDLHNRDFHYLRTDLGGVPNIHMNGNGQGWQLDAEIRRAVARDLELGLGIRYWALKGNGTIDIGSSPGLRLNELESRRAGVTATLAWRY